MYYLFYVFCLLEVRKWLMIISLIGIHISEILVSLERMHSLVATLILEIIIFISFLQCSNPKMILYRCCVFLSIRHHYFIQRTVYNDFALYSVLSVKRKSPSSTSFPLIEAEVLEIEQNVHVNSLANQNSIVP